MGNSGFKCGNLMVQTDQPYYHAGDTVTGHVYLDMKSDFPSNIVYLKVKGYEKCKWSELHTRSEDREDANGNMRSETVDYYEHYDADQSFYKHKIQLHTWGGSTIPQGQYSIPFSFVLQSHLPGSFNEEDEIKNGEYYKASVKYKIKVETESPKGYDKMKNTQELVVREPIKQEQKGAQVELKKETKTCCCIDQGKTKIKCYFENNTYQPGEEARIITEIDNEDCKLDIKQIWGQLYKVIKLESKNHKKTVERSITAYKFEGIKSGDKKKNEDAIRTNIHLRSKSQPIQPSTNGNLVSCRYYLKVSSEMDGCICCDDHPFVTLPIQIVAPPPINYGKITQPPNWQPEVFPVNPLAFTPADIYAPGGMQVNISAGNFNPPPGQPMQGNMAGGFNAPPGAGGHFNQPPGAMNQPPQMNYVPPNPYAQANPPPQMDMNVAGPGFNAPPGQQPNLGTNYPTQEVTPQPLSSQNQQINTTLNSDTSTQHFNQEPI